MLNSLRQGVSSWLIKALLGLLILSFAMWGIGDVFLFRGKNPKIAVIGDRELDISTFVRAYAVDLADLSRRIGRNLTPMEGKELGLVNQTLNRLVSNAILSEASERAHLSVGDDILTKAIFNTPAFQDSGGTFNRLAFDRYLQVTGQTEEEALNSLREELAAKQLVSSVTAGITMPPTITNILFQYREETRDATIIAIESSTLPEPTTPTDSKLEQYYRDTTEKYAAPEYRRITWVHISPQELANEIQISKKSLLEEYNSRVDSYVTPERRNVVQLMFTDEESAVVAHNRLSGGDDPSLVAKEQNALNQAALDLGFVEWENLPQRLAEIVFATTAKSWTEPIKTNLGWHVLLVKDISLSGKLSFDEVQKELSRELQVEQATDAVFQLANRLEDELAAGNRLEDAATTIGLSAHTSGLIDASGKRPSSSNSQKLPNADVMLQVAFKNLRGKVSAPLDTDTGGLVFLRVDQILPSAIQPFKTVRQKVLINWKRAEKAKTAKRIGTAIMAELREGKPIADVARQRALIKQEIPNIMRSTRDNKNLPSELVTKLFATNTRGLVASQLPDDQGYVVAQLDQIRAPSAKDKVAAFTRIKEILEVSFRNDIALQYHSAISEKVGVSIDQQQVNTLDITNIMGKY